MKSSDIVCNNCGHRGHVYRECMKPVLSYGVLLIDLPTTERPDPRILMVQRKDSLCYIEFLRGKYDKSDRHYILKLLNKCSAPERDRLGKQAFDELWMELWSLSTITTSMKFRLDYEKGRTKFNSLRKGIAFTIGGSKDTLDTLLSEVTTNYLESEWEFPKGRRNTGEGNKMCAIREFQEETGYQPDDYSLLLNVMPFEEEYMGENRIKYKHIYYVGYLTNTSKVCEVNVNDALQMQEIRDLKWLSKECALQRLRDYHHTRFRVIHQSFDMVDKLGSDYFIVNTITT